MKNNETLNIIKGIAIVVLFFYGVYFVLTLFDKKHTGPTSYYTVIYTTINGRLYTKDASPEDYTDSAEQPQMVKKEQLKTPPKHSGHSR